MVDNARRYASSEQTSHTLQQSLLPRWLNRVPGLDVVTRYLPATRGLEVGGDFYDMFAVPGGEIVFMIGDVAGHDREAAALMGQLRSAAHALACQVSTPSELIAVLQSSWGILGFDRIATALFCRLDVDTGTLAIASAGHYPPLLVDDNGARYLSVAPAKPLGTEASQAVEWRGELEPGQLLILYTDGAIDEREAGPAASMEALADMVAKSRTIDPAVVCERIVSALPMERMDDIALLAVRLAD